MKIERFNTNHIGGSIVKITSDNDNAIVIDYGMNLDGSLVEDLPDMSNVKAAFITHFHFDHIGMLKDIVGIPVYVNKKAYASYKVYMKHMHIELKTMFIGIDPDVVIQIRDFNVTGLLCSHSAYSSMMYIITVDNRNILHTGDFRLHGIDYSLESFEDVKDNLDILITEGTNITNDYEAKTEMSLAEEMKYLQSQYQYIFVLASVTNYERIKMINDSVNKGRYFLVDEFQREMITSWSDDSLDFKDLVYGDNLEEKLKNRGFVMLVRQGDYFKGIMEKYKENSCLVYSMWRGYLDMYPELNEFIDGYDFRFLHTSGHITKPDLERFINYLNPIDVMMIHTEDDSLLHELDIHAEIIDSKDIEYTWVKDSVK